MTAIEPIYIRLGAYLQGVRKSQDQRLSQEELAEKVGLPRSAISAIEVGRQRVLSHTLFKLCDELEIDISDLFKHVKQEKSQMDEIIIDGDESSRETKSMKSIINKKKDQIYKERI